MIKVIIKKNKEKVIGFKVNGHAEYDDMGKDIVCAAVSILVFNTIDTFIDLLNLKEEIDFKIDENLIVFDLKNIYRLKELELHDSQLILKKFELGIKSIFLEYSDYVSLDYMEV